MKHKILKTISLIGIMTASSLALAEGRYVIRFPIQGVTASPTFGMTESEKQEYIQNKNNAEMCKDETQEVVTEYSVESDDKTYVMIRTNARRTNIKYQVVWLNDQRIHYSGSSIIRPFFDEYKGDFMGRELHTENVLSPDSTGGNYTYDNIYEYFYAYKGESKSENYDWCVDNGYETAN